MRAQNRRPGRVTEATESNSSADCKLDLNSTGSVADMSANQWAIAMRYYASGYSLGLEQGCDLADAEAAQRWRAAGVVLRGLSRRDARPDTEWVQHATGEQLTSAAQQRRTQDVARFRAAHAADRAAQLAGGGPR